MWAAPLFKWLRRKREEKLALRPDVRCLNKAEHYYWVDQKWPCPACCAIEDSKASHWEKIVKETEVEQLRSAIKSLQTDIQELTNELRRSNPK